MPELLNLKSPNEAIHIIETLVSPKITHERISTYESLGRVTYRDVTSDENLPSFPRSSMDGFSVISSDTFGASEGLPAYLEVVGEVPMGQSSDINLSPGQAAKAYTGGMLANGADAIIMIEHTQPANDTTIEVLRPVAPGEHVIQIGEDIRPGDTVLPKGHTIRAQDIGGLLALGKVEVDVSCPPRVSIISTGDELVSPNEIPKPGQIRDINTYTISSLVIKAGGIPVPIALVSDTFESQREAAIKAMELGDIIIFSAGSSVSSRDMTSSVIDSLGDPGVIVHGIAIKPGKPTIIGMIDNKPALGLPGNPVSAMIVFDLLVRPIIHTFSGCKSYPEPKTVTAKLLRDIPSIAGREDYIQVQLIQKDNSLYADPIFGKSNLIYTLVRSDGTVKIPLDSGGLYKDAKVLVSLY